MTYESVRTVESRSLPGVKFAIRRMSFGRRIELMRQIRELAARVEFLEAGKEPQEKIEASLLASQIDRTYLLWGLAAVEGLEIDGAPATPESVVEAGPEALCAEILGEIRTEFGLTEEAAKN